MLAANDSGMSNAILMPSGAHSGNSSGFSFSAFPNFSFSSDPLSNPLVEVCAQLAYVREWGGRFVTAVPLLAIHD